MKNKRLPPVTTDFENVIPLLLTFWRKLHKLPPGPADQLQTQEFRSYISALQKLEHEKNYDDKERLGAYLLYDWVLHYAQGISLIGELPETPRRVLDLCSGAAPFALAALKHGAREVFALDQNFNALKLGADICGYLGHPISIRTHDCRERKFPVEGKWDLIILGYGLLELFSKKADQESYIAFLLSLLSEKAHLLLVDSSAAHENTQLLTLRDLFVEKGIAVQAPCIWRGACPALKHGSSPCYAQRPLEKPELMKHIQRAMKANLSSLKMSYLILKAPGAAWPELPPERLYRVVSPPVETLHGKRFFLCGSDGKRTLGSRLEQHPKQSRCFEYLKRGDLIAIGDALEVKDDLQITQKTELSVPAPCGKPLPVVVKLEIE